MNQKPSVYTTQELRCIQAEHGLSLKQLYLFQKVANQYATKTTKQYILDTFSSLGYDPKLLQQDLLANYGQSEEKLKEKMLREKELVEILKVQEGKMKLLEDLPHQNMKKTE